MATNNRYYQFINHNLYTMGINYDNNFLIPIALSGDKSYNKDNLRRFISEGNRMIHGESTINFERIVEQNIFEKIDSAKECGERVFVIDAPLLFESGLDKICDLTLAVVSDKESRILRIIERDKITRELAEKRIEAQLSESELRERSDDVIENNATVEALKKAVIDYALKRGLVK